MTALVVDTSAMVAIITGETHAAWLRHQLSHATDRFMAAPTALELGMVLETRVPDAVGIGARSVLDAEITVIAFDATLTTRAIDAWRRFGKGRHPAALNYGDCFSYALAEHLGHPILCTGNDFARTDLPTVRPDAEG